MPDDEPKLHIDDDWKSEAAAEKARLAAGVEGDPQHAGPLPEADFIGLVQMIAMQAVLGLNGMRGPEGQAIPPNLDAAKHHIDLLDVLDAKTKGNLTPEEKKTLETTLHQLRLAYVELVRAGAPEPPH